MLKDLAVQVRTDLMAQIIQPWRFTSPEAKLTVHIRDRAPDGELLGLLMHDARDPKQIVTYLAETRPHHQAGRPGLPAHGQGAHRAPPREGGSRRRSSPSSAMRWMPTSSSSAAIRPQSCGRASATPTSSSTPIPKDPVYKANPGSYASELHERFASPLYAFAFVLVVLAFMGQARTTRTSRLQSVISAFGVAVLARVLGISCANLVAVRPAMAPLLYAVPAGTALLAAIAIQWQVYPRRRSRLARALSGLLEAAGRSAAAVWWRLAPARAARARS